LLALALQEDAVRRLSSRVAWSLAALLAACGQQDAAQQQGGPPPAQVTVETVALRSVPVSFEYVGRLEASREVEIRPRVAALIERRYFEEGAPVKAGALLYKLDAAGFAAQARAAAAELANREAVRAEAKLDLERNRTLAAQGFVSARALDAAQTALAVAEAGVRTAAANLADARINLGYTEIHAPLSGVMGRALQVEGALVSPTGPALTTLAQVAPIYARFSIGEDDRLALERQRAEGTLEQGQQRVGLVLADGTRIDAGGTLNFSDYKANPQTGAFDMRAEFANADGALKPGQFVRVVVEGSRLPDAVSVPQPAVQDGPTGKFVYVAAPGGKGMTVALPRPVEVGAWVGGEPGKGADRWLIKSGLTPGDKVVVDGMARIFFPGMPVVPSEAGAPTGAAPAAPPAAAKH
jgi:membrane fusion protein (multidrug efflux system)